MSVKPIPIDTDQSSPIILELLYRLKVRDVMSRDVVKATTDDTMRTVQRFMKENSISGVPIVDGRRLVGLVSVDDVLRALDGGYIEDRVETRMTRNVIVLEEEMPLNFAISYMEKYHFGRFPVLDAHKHVVGIITSRDIIVSLLVEMNKEIERFDLMSDTHEVAEGGFRIEFATRKFDFETAGRLSTEVKKRLQGHGLTRKTIRRVAVACYELEMNQVVHSLGGTVRVVLDTTKGEVEITAVDKGPGIPDVELALTEGYSTANDWIRSLGFGAGMGLPNVKRVSNEFQIESSPAGTTVRAVVQLNTEEERQP